MNRFLKHSLTTCSIVALGLCATNAQEQEVQQNAVPPVKTLNAADVKLPHHFLGDRMPESFNGTDNAPGSLFVDAGPDVLVGCDEDPGDGCVDLVADFQETYETDGETYEVLPIDFDPPFPFFGLENQMNPDQDDRWTAVETLPFEFCYFGALADEFQVGSNGVIRFDVDPGDLFNEWSFSEDLPNNTQPALSEGNVFTPVHDINPATSTTEEIGYEVIGEYPNRVLVVAYSEVPMFSCTSELSTHMAVFYEYSNIIDIYIQNKPICATWNSGNAAVGIQNNAGTIAFVPPGRNTSDSPWETFEEAWRFRPIGQETFDFEWVDENGDFISDETTITVCPDEITTYTARVTYTNTCNNDEVVIEDEVSVGFATAIEMDLGADKVFCEENFQHTISATPDNVTDLGPITYSWYKNGIQLTDTGSVITVDEPGIYTARVAKTEVECEETDSVTITVADFEVDLGEDMEDCDVQEHTLTADIVSQMDIDPNDVTYSWSTGETTASITVTETGTYSVEATYLGCTESDETFVKIADTPEVSLGEPEINRCPDEEITLTASIANSVPEDVTYTWYFNGGEIGENAANLTIDDYGTYVVEVDNDGCIGEAEVDVTNYPNNENCVVTQGISPNGSAGQNDNLDLEFLANQSGIELLQIFNRNGNLVYEQQNYTNEWVGQTDDGDELPTGTYFYIIHLEEENPVYGTQTNGWIYINRGVN